MAERAVRVHVRACFLIERGVIRRGAGGEGRDQCGLVRSGWRLVEQVERLERVDLVAAADLLLQATELAPGFASAWFTLGEIREQLGEREAAVAAFLARRIGFLDIARVVEDVLMATPDLGTSVEALQQVQAADLEARQRAEKAIQNHALTN